MTEGLGTACKDENKPPVIGHNTKTKIMKMSKLFGKILLAGVLLSCRTGFSQTITGQTAGLENTPNGKIIKAWYIEKVLLSIFNGHLNMHYTAFARRNKDYKPSYHQAKDFLKAKRPK